MIFSFREQQYLLHFYVLQETAACLFFINLVESFKCFFLPVQNTIHDDDSDAKSVDTDEVLLNFVLIHIYCVFA